MLLEYKKSKKLKLTVLLVDGVFLLHAATEPELSRVHWSDEWGLWAIIPWLSKFPEIFNLAINGELFKDYSWSVLITSHYFLSLGEDVVERSVRK